MDIEGNVTSTGAYIETVRSLHQTVIALRTALEKSKEEILDLKTKAWPISSIEQSLTALAIENHALRRKLLENNICEDPHSIANKTKSDIDKSESNVLKNLPEDQEHLGLSKEEDKQPLDEEVIDHSLKKTSSDLGENIKDFSGDYTFAENTASSLLKSAGNSESIEVEDELHQANQSTAIKENLEQVKTEDQVVQDKTKTRGSETVEVHNLFENQSNFEKKQDPISSTSTNIPLKTVKKQKHSFKKQVKFLPSVSLSKTHKRRIKTSVYIKAKTFDGQRVSRSLESLTVFKTPSEPVTLSKTTSFFNLSSQITCQISRDGVDMTDNNKSGSKDKFETEQEGQSGSKSKEGSPSSIEPEPEVDDIELIFTTDDTKASDFKEQLVSIHSVENQNDTGGMKLLAPDLEQSLDISDRELDDDVFDGSFDQETQENAFQVFQLRRDNSQLYNSKSDNSINQDEKSLRSYYSYQDSSFENKSLEKDESFDRFEERIRIVETDISKVGIQEVEYAGIRRNTCPNPLQYRPLLHREAMTKGLNAKKSRPILAHSNAIRKESGAQTDISALPGSEWRSESSLANKAHLGDNFTTLPSKFPLAGSRLKMSDKRTVEARRVLLSDIGFTSMVPELSRSADHLCPSMLKPPSTTYGQFLRTPELYSPAYTSQRFTWTTTTATPSDGSQSHSRYSIHPLSPPVQIRRCSAPVSPSRRATLKSTPSRVRFANGSLPELRGDWTQMTADSGDSTDSLVEEAENYLRRSIDCILGGNRGTDYGDTKRNTFRRASAPESTSDNIPPQGWQPFLPRQSRDLKPDHWVKVITPEGKVKGGRVRYIGPIASQTEHFVGVQLPVPEGYSDGTYNTRRYFQCEPYHGIFVPFKKVVMGWRP